MKTNTPNPAPVASGDLSPVDQLRSYHEAIRDESAIIERAAAEAEHLVEIASKTSDPEKRRACNLDLVMKNQEGAIAKARAQSAMKNLSSVANAVLGEIGEMQARAQRTMKALRVNVLANTRKSLAPFYEAGLLDAAVETSTPVREQQAFIERNSPRICGFELECDGKGGARIAHPINASAILSAYGEQKRCLAAIEERARKQGLSPDEISAQKGTPADANSCPRRRVITPEREKSFTHRVELRVVHDCSLSLGYIDGQLMSAAPGDLLDLPLSWTEENFGPCLATELMASERVEVVSKLPTLPKRKFVSAQDLNAGRAGMAVL